MQNKKIESIKLRFINGVHVGRGTDELDKTASTYGSDALKSALYAVGLPYYPGWATEPAKFFEGFTISSAFPWCDNELFLPKQGNIRFHFENGNDLTEAKQAKKIAYISSDVFKQWSANPADPVPVNDYQIGNDNYLFSGRARKFLQTEIQQRVQIPEGHNGDTRLFYFERLLFTENSGLYFLISFHDENLKPQVLHILHVLGDLGIGTDRTVGNGQFEIAAINEYVMPEGHQGMQMALGLFLPSKEEVGAIDLEESHWNLVKRGGYIAGSDNEEFRSLRKNNIYFFGEASTFKTGKTLKGRLVDLQPAWNAEGMHPVWRCGMPMFIKL